MIVVQIEVSLTAIAYQSVAVAPARIAGVNDTATGSTVNGIHIGKRRAVVAAGAAVVNMTG